MKTKKSSIILASSLHFFVLGANSLFAQSDDLPVFRSGVTDTGGPQSFSELVSLIVDLIQAATPVLVALALLAFMWGLVKFIFRVSEDEDAVKDGKNLMKWGLIALFIMITFMTIITFIQGELGFSSFGHIPFLPDGNNQ